MVPEITAFFIPQCHPESVKKKQQKEGVMVRQDFFFMALLILCLIFVTHWGGTHNFRS